MRQHQSILEFQRTRYGKWALLLAVSAILAYAFSEPPVAYVKHYGGTWLGYTLGTVSALLIVWLMLLGIRKRSYRSTLGTLQGWTSAHVYLGTCLVLIATLHCAFEFGWNIHTLAYVLMIAVVVSGFFGMFTYLRYPSLVTSNLGGETVETLVLKMSDLDQKCRRLALDLPNEINAIVMATTRGPRHPVRIPVVGINLLRQLRGVDANCPSRIACDKLVHYRTQDLGQATRGYEQLVTEMTRKSALLDRVRRDLQLRAMMLVWLVFHVPLSFALLAALFAHIVSVFYFW